jgi:SAM-dependent methyltransferase
LYRHTLLACRGCGFITANVAVDDQELKRLYSSGYFRGGEYRDYCADKVVWQRNFQDRLRFLERRVGLPARPVVLEIGSAYGFFGEVLLRSFPGATYRGIEVSPEAVAHAQEKLGLDAVCSDYLMTAGRPAGYTDIFLWDVVEHLREPERFLEKAHGELAPGGRIHLTTGDIGALLPRLQRERWRMIHPPSHLHYFSRKTLSRLLEAKGFRPVLVAYPATWRSMRQIYFSLLLLNRGRHRLAEAIYRRIPESFALPINTFDIMLVTAVKDEKRGRADQTRTGSLRNDRTRPAVPSLEEQGGAEPVAGAQSDRVAAAVTSREVAGRQAGRG